MRPTPGAIPKRPSRRVIALACATAAGFEDDKRTFTRLMVEARINRPDLYAAWDRGVALRNRPHLAPAEPLRALTGHAQGASVPPTPAVQQEG